jgi:hypothetical protein
MVDFAARFRDGYRVRHRTGVGESEGDRSRRGPTRPTRATPSPPDSLGIERAVVVDRMRLVTRLAGAPRPGGRARYSACDS